MTKKDIMELKRRFKIDKATFDHISGCYVNSDDQKVLTFSKSFLNLEENEIFKYLEIAKKTLSGKVNDNLILTDFNETSGQDAKQAYMQLSSSSLDNEELLNRLYDHIIDTYDYVGNYLILLFHDNYDIIVKTSDNDALDESEEVYSYIMCAICPVELSKPGLGYNASNNEIEAIDRDWIVKAPAAGFVYPAFSDRTADREAMIFYTKNSKKPEKSLLVLSFGGNDQTTASEYRQTFESIVSDIIDNSDDGEENSTDVYMDIQEALEGYINENDNADELASEADLRQIAKDAGVSDGQAEEIAKTLYQEIKGKKVTLSTLIDEKVLKNVEKNREIRSLKEQVRDLSRQIIELKEGKEK